MVALSKTALLVLTLASASVAQIIVVLNPANYPKLDTPPPANATWTAKFGVGVPNLLVTTNGVGKPDWSKDITLCTAPKTFAQTFDDGPSPYTPPILDAFKTLNITTTFFVVGSRVISYPDILLRAHQAGHQIAIHAWSHQYMTTQSTEEVISELVWTAKAIRDVIGVTPTYFRPPHGDIDDRIRTIARNMGFTVVNWNIDSNDAQGATNVTSALSAVAQQGSISPIALQHDLYKDAAAQGPPTTNAILATGYQIQRVDQCIRATFPSYSDAMWTGLYEFPNDTFGATSTSSVHTAFQSSIVVGIILGAIGFLYL